MLGTKYLTAVVYQRGYFSYVTVVNCAINRTRRLSFPVLAELLSVSKFADCTELTAVLYREFNDESLKYVENIELIVLGDEPEN